MIAAAYVRTSKEKDDAFSLSSQLAALRQYAALNNIELQHEFKEDYTGTKIDRPELNKLRNLVNNQQIDMVIIYSTDRLARKASVAEYILDELFSTNVQLHLASSGRQVRNTPEDILLFGVECQFAAYERNKTVDRMRQGKKNKLAGSDDIAPMWIGDHPIDKYGYRRVGIKRNTVIERVEEELEVVQIIFEYFYVQRIGVREIVRRLDAAKIPTPSQAKKKHWFQRDTWEVSMIYRILKDEAYIGKWYANRTKQVNGKQVKRDKREWTLLEFPALRVIDDETFAGVQQILAEGRAMNAPNPKYQYLMARKLTCQCKYSVQARTLKIKDDKIYSYYYCSAGPRGTGRNNCTMPNIRVGHLDSLVWQEIEDFLNNPEEKLTALKQAQQELKAQYNDVLTNIERAMDKHAEYQVQLSRYEDLYAQGLMDIMSFKVKREELLGKIQTAIDDAQAYRDSLPSLITDDDMAIIIEGIKDLGIALERMGELDFKQRRKYIERMRVTGKVKIENGHQILYLYMFDTEMSIIPLSEVLLSSPSYKNYPQKICFARLILCEIK